MSWAHPLVLGLVPAVVLATWWTTRRPAGDDASLFASIARLWADRRGISAARGTGTRRALRGVCLALGGAAALLALARPQWGEIAEPHFAQAREVMLAVDLSRSMLADDVAPSRLARAKLLISSLLDELRGERVGLTVFAGTAFVQSPLSADYEVLREFLDELDPSFLPQGGTDYTLMLRTALQGFGQQGAGDRYLVVLSDGEALDEHWRDLVPALRSAGIRVIALGVGTPAGALVPDGAGGLVKDEQGDAVLSRLEPATLQELAAETGGVYRDAASWVDIDALVQSTVAQGHQGDYVEARNARLQDRYQWFLAPAVVFLLLSYWLDFPLSPLARALLTRGRRPHPASAPAIAAALLALAAWHTPRLASAAVPDPSHPARSGAASQPSPLAATVAELSARPQLAAADYARLATETIGVAQQPSALADDARSGVIDDALVAVDRGEAADPTAANWPALRAQLEQLQHPPEPPPSQQTKSEEQQQESQNADGSSGGQDEQGGDSEQKADSSQGAGAHQHESDAHETSGTEDDGKSQSAGSQNAAPPEEGDAPNAQADRHDGSDAPHGDSGRAARAPADAQNEEHENAAGEVTRQDGAAPLDGPEAALGAAEADAHEQADSAPAEGVADSEREENPPAATKLVGGGAAISGDAPGDSALAHALGTMERVQEGDSPAVLFDRMNRADGQPPAPKSTKNW